MESPIDKEELENKITKDGTPNVSLLQQVNSYII